MQPGPAHRRASPRDGSAATLPRCARRAHAAVPDARIDGRRASREGRAGSYPDVSGDACRRAARPTSPSRRRRQAGCSRHPAGLPLTSVTAHTANQPRQANRANRPAGGGCRCPGNTAIHPRQANQNPAKDQLAASQPKSSIRSRLLAPPAHWQHTGPAGSRAGTVTQAESVRGPGPEEPGWINPNEAD